MCPSSPLLVSQSSIHLFCSNVAFLYMVMKILHLQLIFSSLTFPVHVYFSFLFPELPVLLKQVVLIKPMHS